MISCAYCPFGFGGDIVCMNCPTGYRINFVPGRQAAVGQTFSVTKVFHMSTRRIDGKIRCETFTEEQHTRLAITMVAETCGVKGRVFESFRYQLSDSTCVRCGCPSLKFYLKDGDRCPSCGRNGLGRDVVLGPLLKPPRKLE